jgi:hypothetical protein
MVRMVKPVTTGGAMRSIFSVLVVLLALGIAQGEDVHVVGWSEQTVDYPQHLGPNCQPVTQAPIMDLFPAGFVSKDNGGRKLKQAADIGAAKQAALKQNEKKSDQALQIGECG